MKQIQNGTLYVVATPIGNLKDITYRAIEVLKTVDKIVAEDTRHAMNLLKHYSINKPTISMHTFNEHARLRSLLSELQQGKSIALICDAGTPLISDPGFPLVRAAKHLQITVLPIPGACAAIAALSVSGLPADKFIFEGFLPAKGAARSHYLTTLVHETRTLIFYEAPHRLYSTLQNMVKIFGNERKACVARELTKIHETVLTDTLANLMMHFKETAETQRGEIVILIEGNAEKPSKIKEALSPYAVLEILLSTLSLKEAALMTSKITGEGKNSLYKFALSKKNEKNN